MLSFFYGTLREGCYNNKVLLGSAKKQGSIVLEGFELFSLFSYPCAIRGHGNLVGEVWDISLSQAKSIARMEEGAGYHSEQIPTVWGSATIWLMKPPEHAWKIYTGDWLNPLNKKEYEEWLNRKKIL